MAWNATLAIDYGTRDGRTRIQSLRHQGPLQVQKSFHPDESGLVHNYILHPPGGLVGGDRLHIDLKLQARAAALLTTPAAGKVYRTPMQPSGFSLRAQIEPQAELFWLPQENIIYSGAHHRSEIEWIVEPGACLTAWDIQCLGRPGAGETYDSGRLVTEIRLRTPDRLLFLERNGWQGGSPILEKAWGLGGFVAQGTLLMYWPNGQSMNTAFGDRSREPNVEIGLTRRDSWLIARGRATCPLQLRDRFWELLRSLYQEHFGKTFAGPRIWAY